MGYTSMPLELIGRMQLWSSALDDCAECIYLADRLTTAATHHAIVAEESGLEQHYEKVTGRRINLLVAFGEDFDVFANYQRALPIPRECDSAANHLRFMAIMYFMQMYTDGDDDPCNVAANRDAAAYRSKLEQKVYSDTVELKRYRLLTNELRKIRNRQLGHAAGPQFEVKHEDRTVRCTIYPAPLPLINELGFALSRLRPYIRTAIGELLQSSMVK